VLEMAIKHQGAGQIEQAEALYHEILSIQANHAEANHNLGVIEAHLKGAQAALPWLEVAVQVKPENEQYWVSYIDAIMQSSPIDAAISALELGQKYGLRAETAQMLAADYMEAHESKLRLSKQTPATVAKKILNLKIQHELKETF